MGDSIEDFLSWRLSDKRYDAELWNFEYSISRYLLNLSDSELAIRHARICKNISFLVTKIRDDIPIRAHHHSTWWWLRKLNQVLAEYQKRGIQSPRYQLNLTGPSNPIEAFKLTRAGSDETLVRYGEAQWLVPLAKRGHIRFTPASSYKNEELGSARFDDELNQSTFTRGDRVTITTTDGTRIPIIGNLKTTVNSKADLYVFCVSSEFDSRLFAEFSNRQGSPADAYCVIRNVEEFNRRILTEAQKIFSGWSLHHLPIAYFDPYENGKNYISPGASKQFDYAYQREYRFMWLPPQPVLLPGPIDFEVGSLTDIISVYSSDGNILAGGQKRRAA